MAERQAGTPQGGLWYPGEGTFHWRSQEGLEKVTPAPVWVPWLQSDSMEGKAGSREGARRGSVTRDFYEPPSYGAEDQPASAIFCKGAPAWAFLSG